MHAQTEVVNGVLCLSMRPLLNKWNMALWALCKFTD